LRSFEVTPNTRCRGQCGVELPACPAVHRASGESSRPGNVSPHLAAEPPPAAWIPLSVALARRGPDHRQSAKPWRWHVMRRRRRSMSSTTTRPGRSLPLPAAAVLNTRGLLGPVYVPNATSAARSPKPCRVIGHTIAGRRDSASRAHHDGGSASPGRRVTCCPAPRSPPGQGHIVAMMDRRSGCRGSRLDASHLGRVRCTCPVRLRASATTTHESRPYALCGAGAAAAGRHRNARKEGTSALRPLVVLRHGARAAEGGGQYPSLSSGSWLPQTARHAPVTWRSPGRRGRMRFSVPFAVVR